MLKCTIILVLCLFVQAWTQQTMTGSFYDPFLSYNYPYLRYPRRAQSDSDIGPPRRSAYDITPPRRSQPAYDVNPPTRSQPAYDVNPPRRSQPVYGINPPRRSKPVYGQVNAYDDRPLSQVSDVVLKSDDRRSYVQENAYDSPVSQVSDAVLKSDDRRPYGQEKAYDSPVSQVSDAVVLKSDDRRPYGQESQQQDQPVAQKSAYWVEPYRSNARTPLADDTVITPKGASGFESAYPISQSRGGSNVIIAKTPLADDTVITAKDASGFEAAFPISQSRGESNVRDNEPTCILPPLPEHGSYVKNDVNPTLRLGSEIVTLNVTCDPGYIIQGALTLHCYNGFWADDMPKCLPVTCPLKEHHSVEYRCLVIGDVVGSRACHAEEPVGTMVSPLCRKPHFYSTSNNLAFMHCGEDGTWDHVAKCTPECGTVTAKGHGLVIGGQNAKRGEFPWHVGVYLKRTMPYEQACGGTLISNKLIISAAHCFWDDLHKQLPAADFAVAVGKLYRPWGDKMDEAQKSDVKEIHMPPRFQGASSNFQDDIAVVIPVDSFEYKIHVRPVCLSFDSHFDRLQLQTVNRGKVAGWGLTAADGKPSPVLQVLELPYVEVGTCIEHSPPSFIAHITSDKICAGDQNNTTALCRGDSGGGLTFVATDRDTPRYYLRGIVSTAPSDDHDCNTHTYTSFTHVQKHEDFIKQFITEA